MQEFLVGKIFIPNSTRHAQNASHSPFRLIPRHIVKNQHLAATHFDFSRKIANFVETSLPNKKAMKRKHFFNRKTGRMKRLIFFLASFCTIACCQAESNIMINEEKTFVCQSDSASYNCSFCKKITIENKDTANVAVWLEKDIPENRKNDQFYFFFRNIGDFRLYQILWEYGSTLTIEDIETFPCPYSTFFKVLRPKEQFVFYIIGDERFISMTASHIRAELITKGSVLTWVMPHAVNDLSYQHDEIIIQQ